MGTFTINSASLYTLIPLGYDVSVSATACSNIAPTPNEMYIYTTETFLTATELFSDDTGTLAPAGYYSDGTDWRQWDGVAFVASGSC